MKEQKSHLQQIDFTTVFLIFLLMCISLLAIYSSGGQYHSDPFYYVERQMIMYIGGFIVMIVVMMVDYEMLKNVSIPLYVIGMIGLILVETPLGVFRNGAQSWVNLGFTTIQPSEFMKVILVLALAHLLYRITLSRNQYDFKTDLIILGKILAVSLPPFFLILRQPDLGTALVLAALIATVILISGVGWRLMTGLVVFVFLGLGLLVWLYQNHKPIFFQIIEEHQLSRIYGWLNPLGTSGNEGYQLVESLKGVGSGQLYGTGFLQGVQTQSNRIPELHTDFIFSVIGEEFGFLGATLLLVIYFLLFYRMVMIALTCKNVFGTYLVAGIVGLMVFQVFQNIAMTIGVMPITGIPLPFLSYGGTALITNMVAIGLVMNVNMRTKHYMFESNELY